MRFPHVRGVKAPVHFPDLCGSPRASISDRYGLSSDQYGLSSHRYGLSRNGVERKTRQTPSDRHKKRDGKPTSAGCVWRGGSGTLCRAAKTNVAQTKLQQRLQDLWKQLHCIRIKFCEEKKGFLQINVNCHQDLWIELH